MKRRASSCSRLLVFATVSYLKKMSTNHLQPHRNLHRNHRTHHHRHNTPQSEEELQQLGQQQQQQQLGQQQGEQRSSIHRVTVVVLGARGVGKTSIIRQFVYNEFKEDYQQTSAKADHYVSLIVSDRIYEVKLVDCSNVVHFPVSSIQEWNEYRGYCLRTAAAYLLVYDVTDEDSFRFVRNIHEQIVRTRNTHDIPIFVVANKLDLQFNTKNGLNSGDKGSVGGVLGHQIGGCGGGGGRAAANRHDQANIVKKQLKCSGFIECSSKHNWRMVALFREVMRSVDHVNYGHKPTTTRVQDALRNNRCVIV